MKKIFLILILALLPLMADTKKVFGVSPNLTLLLEILYPQGLIGLNYKPYEEDIEFMPLNVANLPVLGMPYNASFEKIVSYKPDFIFAGKNYPEELKKKYESFKVEVVLLDDSNKDELIRTISSKLDIKERGERLIKILHKNEDLLKSLQSKITKRPKIYLAQGYNGFETQCAKDNDNLELVFLMGGENSIKCSYFTQNARRLQVNFELLSKYEPDMIFVREISFYKELMNNPSKQWANFKAVKQKQIYYAPSSPSNWLTRPPTIMQSVGLLWAMSKTQPTLFSDEEAKKIAQEFYKEFLQELNYDAYIRLQGLK
ncbi:MULTISPECIES: ABC transporter substrate-binding protein [unclassified Campylobacter]|uniref:ABC transporter substrate-binding protein n=1 Tax=unclassified Campylobacter TaxID=2593542 RepID=UPI001237DF9C|nr:MULTISPECIES: ABC transporter substrate-binding protein [unclassified Campylobacter]KAA6224873.1 ABC transporter substrate-binding protein [Campylobacter sp. LR185c]KAA6226342.1 ABC transporter substrate-binding protein [Campylobacter sp. LR286c]KAA6226834.1 ABC transporter substrate-binding protein [Campylobacter sp. LR196d]KAA6230271.1 ABC transporter substrate-binding protein [Campylobacter sp. LR291e]KAA6233792.1 ABC transporter substrate-binding protein [Campylobacter sp. LR264d]